MTTQQNLVDFFPLPTFRPRQEELLLEIQKALDEGFKTIIVQAPTGIGKSPIAVAICKYFELGYICTSQKVLQDQYQHDFKELATVKGRSYFRCSVNPSLDCGRGQCQVNDLTTGKKHTCTKKPKRRKVDEWDEGWVGIRYWRSDMTVDDYVSLFEIDNPSPEFAAVSASRGPLEWQDSNPNNRCEYYNAKTRGLQERIVIQNYAFMITESNFVGDFGPRKVLVSDEAHNIEKHVLDSIKVEIRDKDLSLMKIEKDDRIVSQESFTVMEACYRSLQNKNQKTEMRKKTVKQADVVPIWFDWLGALKKRLPDYISDAENVLRVRKTLEISHAVSERIERLEDIRQRMDYLLNQWDAEKKAFKDNEEWVAQVEWDRSHQRIVKISFLPLYIRRFVFERYFRLGDINILLSATILDYDKMVEEYGLDPKTTTYIPVEPVFPAENHKLYHLSVAKTNWDNLNPKSKTRSDVLDRITESIDCILDIFPDKKGIIHGGSNDLCDEIFTRSKHGSRILRHTIKDRAGVLKEHTESSEPTVLCSPSMTEGVDLKDDASHFQIFVKIPYLDSNDERIKRRLEKRDWRYYNLKTCLTLIQGLGRSVRSPTDRCITFTLDDRFDEFCRNNGNLLNDLFNRHNRDTREFFKAFRNDFPQQVDKLETFYTELCRPWERKNSDGNEKECYKESPLVA